jgi:hypothetical protein
MYLKVQLFQNGSKSPSVVAYNSNPSTPEQRQEDQKLEASLGYMARPYLKKQTNTPQINKDPTNKQRNNSSNLELNGSENRS